MKGNRPKKQANETAPSVEVLKHERDYEVRFNFAERQAAEDVPASFDYEYIRVKAITKKVVKMSVIKTAYPDYDDELSVINNKESDVDAYNAYQQFRTFAESIANEAINAQI